MKSNDAIGRVLAWHEGKPRPRGSTVPFRRGGRDERLVVVFLTMAGETAPWGVAWGYPGRGAQVSTTPDPRNRDAAGEMLVPFAKALFAHLGHPSIGATDDLGLRRSIWVPGASHVDMLHLLQYRWQTAKSPEARVGVLQALGRAAGWLFRQASEPGQRWVFDASAALRELYTFPADDARLAHLGFALAWLNTNGDRGARVAAAAEAERDSVGTTMSPDFERDHLEADVDAYAKATRGSVEGRRIAERIGEHLTDELLRRFRLVEGALEAIDADPRPDLPMPGDLEKHAAYVWSRFHGDEAARVRGEKGFDVHPETDRHVDAAKQYVERQRSQDLADAAVLHGDEGRRERAVEDGDALRGTITRAQRTGGKRSKVTMWTVESSLATPLRLREESKVCLAGVPKLEGKIRGIAAVRGRRVVVVEVTGGYDAPTAVGLPAAHDVGALVGCDVTLVPSSMAGVLTKKSMRIKADGPGAWLTDAAPTPPPSRAREVSEDVLAIVEGMRG